MACSGAVIGPQARPNSPPANSDVRTPPALTDGTGGLYVPVVKSLPLRRRSFVAIFAAILPLAGFTPSGWAADPAARSTADATPLFDGRTLAGWKANEGGRSFRVEDGAIVCDGPRSHLFYVGADGDAEFQDFEFKAEVLTRPGANSGVYFHTAYQDKDWPSQGFEVQVNNTATGEGGYRENKKTGSLYGLRNVHKQLVPDDQWFTLRIQVRGRSVKVWVNDIQTVDYLEPDHPYNAGYAGRRLGRGTFALQCHDTGSRALFRNLRVRRLPPLPTTLPVPAALPLPLAELHAENYPVIDLHTHLKGGLTVAEVVRRQFDTGINAGIAINGGLGFPVTNDVSLAAAVAQARHPLTWIALQAEGREWTKLFSRDAAGQVDYVFTDAMTIFNDAGKRMRLWIPEETEVGEPQAFMDLLVRRTVDILDHEPIDLWVNPTYLPAAIAADYDKLWSEARMRQVIDAAVRHGIAIEINDRFRIPGLRFVKLAKQAGAKFTLGTNNAGKEDLGRLAYGAQVIHECGLKWDDLWVPGAGPRLRQAAP